MELAHSILDPSFRYVPAAATSVADTWRRYGWRPTTAEERRTRRRPALTLVVESVAPAVPLVRTAQAGAPAAARNRVGA
jgi:hypothetical protein